MKIEKIHFNKIKVTFSVEDLIEHNITPEAVRNNAPWVQKILMTVVERARDEIGFEANDARLMVEAMPGANDSMVMYITRLAPEDDIKDVLQNAKKRLKLKIRPTVSENSAMSAIVFDDFEDAIKLAHSTDFDGGELYFYLEKYYLIVSSDSPWYLAEFGKYLPDDILCDLICEHGKKIADNALKTLRENF